MFYDNRGEKVKENTLIIISDGGNSENNVNFSKKSELSETSLCYTRVVILNHGQVTWTTPELAPPSPNYHTTPTGGRFSFDRFNVHRCPNGMGSNS
ncbi:hypothetical protein TNCV_2222391 [Trichonephila clavipes]|nr:hypothetical protein TNCV_2222391 [Trichonephila clavipes]